MANTTVNKVILGDETLLDLTGDTATAADVVAGKTFHLASGAQATGQLNTGGDGASSWTHVKHAEINANVTSSTATVLGNIDCGVGARGPKMLYVMVRDMAGARDNYFCGSDSLLIDWNWIMAERQIEAWPDIYGDLAPADLIQTIQFPGVLVSTRTGYEYPGTLGYLTTNAWGVYPQSITAAGVIAMRGRYNKTYSGTINGTYAVDVYTLDYPDGKSYPV